MGRLIDRTSRLKVGDGLDPDVIVGPLASQAQLETVTGYIGCGTQEGSTLVYGGSVLSGGIFDEGYYVEPTIFADVDPSMRIAREEIFGPVLSILRARSLEEAVEIANGVEYGLASAIFTNDLARAMTFVEKTRVGLTHVNMPTAYKEAALEFGGVKASGAGPPEAGQTGIEFFTDHKVVYVKYR